MLHGRDGSDRYATNWPTTTARARHQTQNRCCWCCCADADSVHHAYYWKDGAAIKGIEVPGRDVFPLCDTCHTELHSDRHWIGISDPWARTNKAATIERLRANFHRLRGSHA